MRRLSLVFIIAFAVQSFGAGLTGTIRRPDGSKLNGRIRMTLSHPARDTSSSSLIVPQTVEFKVMNGKLPSNAAVSGNDVLEPSYTYYWTEYFDAYGAKLMENPFYVAGSSFDLGAARPTTITTTNISFVGIPSTGSCASGQFVSALTSSGPTCQSPATIATLAGDVTGAPGSNSVGKIRGFSVSSAAPTDGYVLTWSSASSQWQPAAGSGATAHNLLSATHGDTVVGSPARGSLIIGNALPKWEVKALGGTGTVLRSDGTDANWAKLNLSTDTTGILGVSSGGTGIGSGTSGGIPYFSAVGVLNSSAALDQYKLVMGGGPGASPSTVSTAGSAGQVLYSNGAGAPPTWGAITISPLSPGSSVVTSFANEGMTGTSADKLVKIAGDPVAAIINGTADLIGAFGICTTGCGTTGSATIAVMGQANCVFDGAVTALDYVQQSPTVAGDCHSAGSTYPVGVEVVGRALETGVAGTHPINLFLADVASASGGGAGKGTTIKVGNSALAATVGNLSNTTPAAGAGYLNVGWQKDSNSTATNISARVAISGNTSTVATTSGSLTNGHFAGFDANGNIVDGGTGSTVTTFSSKVTFDKGFRSVPVDVSPSSGTIAIDLSQGNNFRFTLDTSCPCTISFSNQADGDMVLLESIQYSGGSKTLSLGTVSFGLGITAFTQTATASKRDFIGLRYSGTTWYVIALQQGY